MSESPAVPVPTINGAYVVPLRAFRDERGQFMEVFRKAWFPQVSWDALQNNRSISRAGVLRGLHYHFHQVDYWHVPAGRVRAAMADLRPSSPTYMQHVTIELGTDTEQGLFIPSGVAHGFLALTDATLMYIVNQYFDGGSDERGLAWDDPELGVQWGLADVPGAPLLSERDRSAHRLKDIPPDELPR